MQSTTSRGGRRRRGAVLATLLVAASTVVLLSGTALAAPMCATPGRDGSPPSGLSGVVNTYYPGTPSVAAGATSVGVGAATGSSTAVAAGDLLLVIQMQAASINSTNSNSYGDGLAGAPASGYTAGAAAGTYEYVRATTGVVGGVIGINGAGTGNGLVNAYTSSAATATAGQQTFQVVRVPQHTSATFSPGLTAAAWNGATGGVLAVDVAGTLTLSGTVSVNGLGFRGALARQTAGAPGLADTDWRTPTSAATNGRKGEASPEPPPAMVTRTATSPGVRRATRVAEAPTATPRATTRTRGVGRRQRRCRRQGR